MRTQVQCTRVGRHCTGRAAVTLETITRDTYARKLGLIQEDGEISRRSLAGLLRAPLARWGLSPRKEILRYAREQLEAAGVLDRAGDPLLNSLDALVRLGECVEVHVGGDRYLAPPQPRWMLTGRGIGALLGVAPVPGGVEELQGAGNDIVRRIRVGNDEDLDRLHMAGIRQVSVQDWLGPPGYLRYAADREGRLLRNDEISLARFWDLLEAALAKGGQSLDEDARARAVAGEPGGVFGKVGAETCEGRWTESAPDGIWCASRQGYGSSHRHPILMQVSGLRRRALDLYDWDEWRWALLAKGRRLGEEERVERRDNEVRMSFPPPLQLASVMDLLGPRRAAWSWEVAPGAPEPWRMLE